MSNDPHLDATMAAARLRTIHDRQRKAGDDKARAMMAALMGR